MERKISVFIPTLNGGGAEKVMVTLANAFSARGYDVDLVLVKKCGPYIDDVLDEVNVVNLDSGRTLKALFPLIKYFLKSKPAAILSAMTHANLVAIGAKMLSRTNAKLVVSEHGLISGECALSKTFVSKLVFFLVPFFYKYADNIIAVSDGSAKDLSNFSGISLDSIETIYNPFNLEKIRELSNEPAPHPWLCHEQPPVIMALGRLNEAKCFDVLIRAFSEIVEDHDVRLIILGEGELRSELELLLKKLNLSSDQVILPGFVENPYSWLSRCECFVLSSRREALSCALIEAIACGAKVISTDCKSGPREILEDGKWGKLVPVNDTSAMVKAINNVLNASSEGNESAKFRAQDFSLDKGVDRYISALGLK